MSTEVVCVGDVVLAHAVKKELNSKEKQKLPYERMHTSKEKKTKKSVESKKKLVRSELQNKKKLVRSELQNKKELVHSELQSQNKKLYNNEESSSKKKGNRKLKYTAKELRYEKKKAMLELHELQDILGVEPSAEEQKLEEFIFGADDLDNFEDSVSEEEIVKPTKKFKPVWEDEDDTNALLEEAQDVQKRFNKIIGEPKWAELGREQVSDDDDSGDELLKKAGNFIQPFKTLSKGLISYQKCPSLVDESLKNSIIKSVEFHPTCKVAAVAGTNGTANLFQIDGKVNAKIQSVHFENFPIHAAHFSVDGNEVVVGSNKFGHFFSYDMLSGKILRIPWDKGMEQQNIRKFQMCPDGKYIAILGRNGYIHLVTAKSKEWIGSLKMNGEVVAVCFNKDGSKMYSHGETGEIYVWDMSSRKCIHKFIDEGCVTGTSLALSPSDQFLAAGSDSGIVNIYDNNKLFESNAPQPLKVLKNLTTEVTQMKFNCTSEALVMNSSHKQNAVKLVHFPSMTVFSNFPLREDLSTLKYVNSVDISANSGYLCLGNNLSTVHIFRLKHYHNY